jgi:hypothetical protein
MNEKNSPNGEFLIGGEKHYKLENPLRDFLQ